MAAPRGTKYNKMQAFGSRPFVASTETGAQKQPMTPRKIGERLLSEESLTGPLTTFLGKNWIQMLSPIKWRPGRLDTAINP